MTKKVKGVLLLAAAAVAVVLIYNIWSYSCGHCTFRSMMTLGTPGYLLLQINAALLTALVILKLLSTLQARKRLCSCGERLLPGSHYCPACGNKAGCQRGL